MATNITMPRMSESMEEGTVLTWLVDVGSEVKRGEALVEIETDKANMTYEADVGGVLLEVVAAEGQVVPCGQVIARIGSPDDVVARGRTASQVDGARTTPATRAEEEPGLRDEDVPDVGTPPASEPAPAPSHGDARPKASPMARILARELDIDLRAIRGTGPQGRIVKADVDAAAAIRGHRTPSGTDMGEAFGLAASSPGDEEMAAGAPSAVNAPVPPLSPPPAGALVRGPARIQELTRLQLTVGRRMAESKVTAPDFELRLDVEMTSCLELRARLKAMADPAPSVNDMVVKAVANALRRVPRVNGAFRDGRWELYPRINVGIAVSAEEALVVPVLLDADHKSLAAIARETRDLIAKVRNGAIMEPDLVGGTFTVSNLGMTGIDSFSPVINPPEAAILAVGAVKKKPVVDGSGAVIARDLMTTTLVCDHRILYGAEAAEFLAAVRQQLEQPLALLLE